MRASPAASAARPSRAVRRCSTPTSRPRIPRRSCRRKRASRAACSTTRCASTPRAFAYAVNDIQLNGNDSNGNGVLFNADKAEAYGMEAEAELAAGPEPHAARWASACCTARSRTSASTRRSARSTAWWSARVETTRRSRRFGANDLRADRRQPAAERAEVQPRTSPRATTCRSATAASVFVADRLEHAGLHQLRALQDRGVHLERQLRGRPEDRLRRTGRRVRNGRCSRATSPTRRTSRA